MIENSAGAAAQRNTLLDVTKYFFYSAYQYFLSLKLK